MTALYSSFGQGKEEEEIVINSQTEEDPSTNVDPKQGTSKQAIVVDSDPPKVEPKKVTCKFCTNGARKYKKECRFDHPNGAKKLQKNGSFKKWNPTGCDGNCNKFHPNVCKDSLRSKECPRENCHFFHLKGTQFIKKYAKTLPI